MVGSTKRGLGRRENTILVRGGWDLIERMKGGLEGL